MTARPDVGSRYEQFLALAVQLGAGRERTPDYAMYSRLKREAERDFPGASPDEWDRLVRVIAMATGVSEQ